MAEKILKNIAEPKSANGETFIDIASIDIRSEICRESRILNATLILTPSQFPSGNSFNVYAKSSDGNKNGEFETIDHLTPINDKPVYINITQEANCLLKNPKETATIKIASGISFLNNSDLKLEYIPERIMHEGNAYYDISAGRAGGGKVNLATGALQYAHSDSAASGISHVYNTWQADKEATVIDDAVDANGNIKAAAFNHSCGKGWKLNLHQYLVRRKGTDQQDVFTYIDGNGNYHEFTEKYYYIDDKKKKRYVDKAAVNIGFNGKLTHKGIEVKTELKTTSGLTLSAELKDFKGIEKLELRSEERVRIEEDIENLKRTIADCKYALEEHKKTEGTAYKALIAQQRQIENDSAALERQSMVAHERTRGLTDNVLAENSILNDNLRKDTNGEYTSPLGREYENKLVAYNNAADAVQNAQIRGTAVTPGEVINLAGGGTYTLGDGPSRLEMETQRDRLNELNTAQKNLNTALDLLQQSIRENSYQIETINWGETKAIHTARQSLLNLQDAFRTAKRAYENDEERRQNERNNELHNRTTVDLKKAQILLELREFNFALLKEQEPTRFLTDSSGLILAFNEMGVLIAIADAYENITFINYEDGRIVSLTDGDNNETAKMEYDENGLLARIIDADEKVIHFDYFNGTLARVTYPDGAKSEFNYIGEFNLLRSAVNPTGYGIRFTYSYQKVVKTEEFTSTFEITENGLRGLDSPTIYKDVAKINYHDTNMSTTITDRFDVSTTYIFDILGKPVTVHEGDAYKVGKKTKSLSIDYSGSNKAFNITDNILHDNLLENAATAGTLSGNPTQTSREEFDVDISSLPDGATNFVFSAWAKADSAFVNSCRRTAYSFSKINDKNEESDENKKKRKFELRAELTYNEGEPCVYLASFDWLNTNWQYLALPVAINEDCEVGDRLNSSAILPLVLGNQKRKLTDLKLILDYSHNVNNVEFGCATLRQGSWELSRFDKDGKVEFSEDSNGNKTKFSYDENGNLVKTTITDRQHREYINTSEYNKQGRVVRSTDFNGLVEETVYDDKGKIVRTINYNVSDPSSKLYNESVRDEKGRVVADVDITGEFNSAEYGFDHKGNVNVIADALGNKTAFGYHNDNLVSISGNCNGEENSNVIKHTLGFVTKVSSGGTDYGFTYDEWGRQKEVLIANERYSRTDYIDDKTTTVTLANGEAFTEYADGKDNKTTEVEIFNGEKFNCRTTKSLYTPRGGSALPQAIGYHNEITGLIARSVDKSGKKTYNTDYAYDRDGRLVSKIEDGAGTLEHDLEYDRNGGVRLSEYRIDGIKQTYAYGYDNALDDRQVKIILPSGAEQQLQYDGLGRVTGVSLGDKFTKDIYYAKFGDHATKYVNSVWEGVNGKRDKNTRYTYDKNGNITRIRENGKETVRYTYDSLNRLIREDNAVWKEKIGETVITGKTETYEYDNNGNILRKTKYPYTLSEKPTGGTHVKYGYSLFDWKDRLFSYNHRLILLQQQIL
jgi:YD repeat-containing protein